MNLLCVLQVAGLAFASLPSFAIPGAPSISATPTASTSSAMASVSSTAGIDAYIYGYAPVILTRNRAVSLCQSPGVNKWMHRANLSTPDQQLIVAPNADTLYSSSWIDLRNGPVVFDVPAMNSPDRYNVVELLDIYTNNFASVGTRTYGNEGGSYAVTPPGWNGTLDDSLTFVAEAPTWDLWALARIFVFQDRDGDLSAVQSLQQQLTISVLNDTSGISATPQLPDPDCSNLPNPETPETSGAEFFDEVADVLLSDPPPSADAVAIANLASLNVTAGGTPSQGSASPQLAAAVTAGNVYLSTTDPSYPVNNFWSANTNGTSSGTYGTDYETRAITAKDGLGANVPQEAVYYNNVGVENGSKEAELTFEAGNFPPINGSGFWSVTAYNLSLYLMENSFGRYSINSHTAGLDYASNGSLTLHFGATEPAKGTSNWLPTPTGPYVLVMRNYLPTTLPKLWTDAPSPTSL